MSGNELGLLSVPRFELESQNYTDADGDVIQGEIAAGATTILTLDRPYQHAAVLLKGFQVAYHYPWDSSYKADAHVRELRIKLDLDEEDFGGHDVTLSVRLTLEDHQSDLDKQSADGGIMPIEGWVDAVLLVEYREPDG